MPDLSGLIDALAVQGSITLLGYVAGTSGLVTHSRSLGEFVTTVAYPCLLARSMAKADLSTIDLTFMFGMTLSKGLILTLATLIYSQAKSQSSPATHLTIA